MNEATDYIDTPWEGFVNDNYDKLRANDIMIKNAVAHTRAEMGEPATWKDAVCVMGWLAFYGSIALLIAKGFYDAP